MRMRKTLFALAGALFLGGCAISTPYSGPGLGPEYADDTPVVVSLTLAVLNDDDKARDVFWKYTRIVDAKLETQPGFVGETKRVQIFGNKAWTMTVWRDEASLTAFLKSDAHRSAVQYGMPAINDAKFLRLNLPVDQVPLPWDEAIARLDREGRHYFE